MQKFINIDPMEPGTVHETDALLVQSLSSSDLQEETQSFSIPSESSSVGITLTANSHNKKDMYDMENAIVDDMQKSTFPPLDTVEYSTSIRNPLDSSISPIATTIPSSNYSKSRVQKATKEPKAIVRK